MGKTANWSHDRLRVNTPVLRLEVRANPGDFFCPIDRHMRINSERVSPAIGPVLTKLISLPIAKSIQKYELVKTVNPVANKVECADFRQQLSVAELSKSLAWSSLTCKKTIIMSKQQNSLNLIMFPTDGQRNNNTW